MTSLDLSHVHPVLLAWLRWTVDTLPGPLQATPAEAAETVPIQRWAVKPNRWGFLWIDGAVLALDGFAFMFRVDSVAVDLALLAICCCHGRLRLGAPGLGEITPSPEAMGLHASKTSVLNQTMRWCAALRCALRT